MTRLNFALQNYFLTTTHCCIENKNTKKWFIHHLMLLSSKFLLRCKNKPGIKESKNVNDAFHKDFEP